MNPTLKGLIDSVNYTICTTVLPYFNLCSTVTRLAVMCGYRQAIRTGLPSVHKRKIPHILNKMNNII